MMEKLISIRNNKNHKTILLNEISERAFKEARALYDITDGIKVIKPTKKAIEKFSELHTLTLDKVKTNEKYKILGVTFKIKRKLDFENKHSNSWFPIVEYFNTRTNKKEEFGIVSTDNFAIGVYEICFELQTSKLLFF